MTRALKPSVLDQAAKYYAALFVQDKQDGPMVDRTRYTTGRKEGEWYPVRQFSRDWVILQFFDFTFKDEFEYMVQATRSHMGPVPLAAFDAEIAKLSPRSEEMFQRMLAETGQV